MKLEATAALGCERSRILHQRLTSIDAVRLKVGERAGRGGLSERDPRRRDGCVIPSESKLTGQDGFRNELPAQHLVRSWTL